MDAHWLRQLPINPLPSLLAWGDPALTYHVQRDLLDQAVGPVESLWVIDSANALVRKQQDNGSWRYSGKSYDPVTGCNYDLLETYRNLRILVELYGFDLRHPAIPKAADYVFSCQTEEGDVRGILGNQYMPYYHGAILELLIKAGYDQNAHVMKGLEWLLSMQQVDGGWIVPAQVIPANEKTSQFWLGDPLPPERSRPASHLATGMVLRAFAAHQDYRQHAQVIAAGDLLKSRLFKADKYNDRKAPSYWLKFQFPFWWASLLTALDTLSGLGFSWEDKEISAGLVWFRDNQSPDGLWETGYGLGRRAEENRRWVGLAACRMLKRFMD